MVPWQRYLLMCCAAFFPLMVWADPLSLGVTIPRSAAKSLAQVERTMDTACDAGAQQVRISADWQQIQPRADAWDFTFLDAAVRAARERKLNVVLVLGPSPGWTVTYLGKNPSATEISRARPNLSAYRTYATRVAQRYQDRVSYYQLWERPCGSTLLALPGEVMALYRIGASAIHSVNPTLQAIAPEPGDVNLGWIAEYLKTSQGTACADIISVAPVRPTLASRNFAWHLQVLRQRILPQNKAVHIWGDIVPAQAENPTAGGDLAAMAVLAGIPNLTFVAVEGGGHAASTLRNVTFFAGLHRLKYAGWLKVGSNILGGVYRDEARSTMLLLPTADGSLWLNTDPAASPAGVAVPGRSVGVTTPSMLARKVSVTEPVALPVTAREPVLLDGVQAAIATGRPVVIPVPIRSASVTLDLTGTDAAGIQLLRTLPGGEFNRFTLSDGRTVISTIRETNPWVHFDVPDGFLFYNVEQVPVAVTVQVFGAVGREKSGFNLYYDAVGGMRNSSWQWIDVGSKDIFTYTIRLNDAMFAGSEGYDLRLNMGGSSENVRLVNISLIKLPTGKNNSAGKR